MKLLGLMASNDSDIGNYTDNIAAETNKNFRA